MRARAPVPALLKTSEVETRLNVSLRSVKRWIASGELRSHVFGTTVRVSEDDLASFIAARRR